MDRSVSAASDSERRRFHRVEFAGHAFLDFEGREHAVNLLDLSLHGARVTLAEGGVAPARDCPCTLRVPLAEDLEIRMQTRVVRVDGVELGLMVDRLDLDDARHLRRLVELNLGDSALLHRDLAALFRD